MKKIFNILSLCMVCLLLLPACSKENMFDMDNYDGPVGTLKKPAVDVNTGETLVKSGTDVDLNSFIVDVTANGKTYYSGSMKDMPEVLTLPVGTGYTVNVHSPENPAAEWESPYYTGTQTFDIAENDITEIEPVVCKLGNVKVTVVFEPALLALMEDDCQVKVETGNGASLIFGKNETRSGHFRYETEGDNNTLVATFTGTVDENYENNFRTYTQLAPGNHYVITYRLHGLDPEVPEINGTITLGAIVDAEVTRKDLTVNIDDEDELLADNERPGQGEDPNPPTPPTPGDNNPPAINITDGISWTQPNIVPSSGMEIKVTVHSDHPDGIKAFTVDIDSETLTDDVLTGVGLASHLDLVNPGNLAQGLTDLHFPINVGGQQDPDVMDITEFTKLLGIYGAATHKFTLTVTDGYGTTKKTLTLVSQ